MSKLKFADINVGAEIPVDIRRTVTREMVNRWAEVSVDFNPLHVDPEFGKTTQFGGNISHGTLTITFITEMLTRWLGDGWLAGGQLKEMRFVAPVKLGDTVRPRGKVVAKREGAGKKLVECEVWLENQDGTQTIVGKAVGETD